MSKYDERAGKKAEYEALSNILKSSDITNIEFGIHLLEEIGLKLLTKEDAIPLAQALYFAMNNAASSLNLSSIYFAMNNVHNKFSVNGGIQLTKNKLDNKKKISTLFDRITNKFQLKALEIIYP